MSRNAHDYHSIERTNTMSTDYHTKVKQLFIYRALFFCWIFCFSISSQANSETLLEIYALAKENDHQLKADYAEYLAGIEAAAINRAALRPTITVTASGSLTNSDQSGSTTQESDTDNVSYGVNLTQSLFDSSLWHRYDQGKIEQQTAIVGYEADQQSLIIRSAQAYFNVLRATDQLDTAKSEEKAQSTLLEQTRQRYEVGLVSINDVHETQAAYDSAVASTIDAEASVGIQYDFLTVLTGQLHSAIIPLKNNFTATMPVPNNQKAWVDFALKNNYSLKSSELNTQAAQLNAKAASSEHEPTLTGSLSYNRNHQDIDINGSNSADTRANTAVARLDLTIPLYSGGGLSARSRQAAQQAINAQETTLLTRRNVIQSTRSLYLSVTTDIAQIKARKQAIVSNESALDATRAGYDAGTRDIVDVVNAQRNLFQAQRDYFDSLYNYIINTLQLKEAAGNLHVSDLEEFEKYLAKP